MDFSLGQEHSGSAVKAAEERCGLRLWPAEACLMTELSRELARLDDDQLRACQIILPTKRLSTWLMAMLGRERGVFIPPRCLTLDDFIAVHAPAGGELRVMADLEQELLLANLLKDSSYRHLRYGHEHEIKQLLSELTDWGMDLGAFDQLAELVGQNVFLSDGSLDTLSERFRELGHLAQRFYEAAANVYGAETSAQRQARQSVALANLLAPGLEAPWFHLYAVGLTSAQGIHQPLLRALARRGDCSLWLNTAPRLYSGKNPLELLQAMIGQEGSVAASLPPVLPPTPLRVRRTDTVLGEVAHALTLAKEAVAAGVPPSGVAILVTNDAAYGKPLRALLAASGLPANVALGTPLGQTLPGTWLSAVLELLLGSETVAHTIALLTHPLTRAWWHRLQPAGDEAPAAFSSRISRELCGTEAGGGLAALLASPRLSSDMRLYLQSVTTALGCWAERPTPVGRPLADWAAVLNVLVQDFLTSDAALSDGDDSGSDKGLLTSAEASLAEFCTSLNLMAQRLHMRLTQREFLQLLRDKLLGIEVRSVGDPLRGLQVLSVAEARYVPFDVVMVLGASEGNFPRSLPRDHLVDNYLKTKIGLPGWQLLEAIEDTTFTLLRARLPALILLYPASRGGDSVVRSRFIEAAVALGEAREEQVDTDEQLLSLLHADASGRSGIAGVEAGIERYLALAKVAQGAAAADVADRWTGGDGRGGDGVDHYLAADPTAKIAANKGPVGNSGRSARLGPQGVVSPALKETLLASQSATSLSYLLSCPYRFLLHRLGLQPQELPTDDDLRREGSWLHSVLECFFTGRANGKSVLPPLRFVGPTATWAEQGTRRLDLITGRLLPEEARDSPLALHVLTTAWPAFAAHVAALYASEHQPSTEAGERERPLAHKDGSAVRLKVSGHEVVIKGSIDSVDAFASWHLVTDYKRRGAPSKKELKEGRVPQLLLYGEALAAMGPQRPLRQAIVGYWNMLAGRWQAGLAGSEVMAQAKALKLIGERDQVTLEEATAQLHQRWQSEQDRLLQGGDFTVDPRDCHFCSYSGVCRRDDPEFAERLQRVARTRL